MRFGRFYLARGLRLLPPLLLVLAGYLVVEGVLGHLDRRDQIGETLFAALTYTSNLPFVPHGSASFFHLWTLATEEQFYLLWPLLLALAWRRRAVVWLVVIGVVGSLLACVATMALSWPDIGAVYPLPTSWSIALVVGCALRLWRPAAERLLPSSTRARAALGVVVLAAFAAGTLVPSMGGNRGMYLVVSPAVTLASALLILLGADARWSARGLLRPLVLLGTISYAAYLWNLPIRDWLGDPRDLPGGMLGAALTILAATLSWWAVERPAAALRRRIQQPRAIVPPSPQPVDDGSDDDSAEIAARHPLTGEFTGPSSH